MKIEAGQLFTCSTKWAGSREVITSYYYKKEREGSRVKSVYVGRGEVAQMVSQIQITFGPVERLARVGGHSRLAEVERADLVVDQSCALIELIKQASLIVSGFHLHKRQWRKQRHADSS